MSKTFRHDPRADALDRNAKKAETFNARRENRHAKRLIQEANDRLLELMGLDPETLRPVSGRLC